MPFDIRSALIGGGVTFVGLALLGSTTSRASLPPVQLPTELSTEERLMMNVQMVDGQVVASYLTENGVVFGPPEDIVIPGTFAPPNQGFAFVTVIGDDVGTLNFLARRLAEAGWRSL